MKTTFKFLKMGGIILPFLISILANLVPVNASSCKDINIIFARGSSQNYIDENTDLNFPMWDVNNGKISFDKTKSKNFITTEKESAKYFEGIGNNVLEEYPTLTMQFVSLHDFANKYNQNGYRAVPAFGSAQTAFLSRNAVDAAFGGSSIIGESTYGDYRQSVQDGADELAGYLADEMVRCPSQYTVLGGYSQGAQVVGDALALMHTRGLDNLLSRLGHVDLFGDPKFNGFSLDTSRINPLQQHTPYPWVRGSANINEVGALGPRKPYVPDILTAQTTSWCDFNDVVCGGFAGTSASDFQAHGHVYSDTGGWIEKSTNETYVAMKHRLSLLAGVTDKSANAPKAFWPGITNPSKIDIMFVMDSTADENLSLVPDPDYLGHNFNFLSTPTTPLGVPSDDYYSSVHAGVATYTEFQEGDNIISYPKLPVYLTEDVYGEFGAFKTGWAQAHFLGNNVGGVDLQDSPFSAIKLALDQQWRSDARKVIVLFSNSYGKDKEPGTNLTMKQITAKARAKGVEILPVFTSRTFRANANNVQYVPAANAFYNLLAKQSGGHATEVTDSLSSTLVYDVIMGHIYAPDVVISTGKTYVDPKTKKPTSSNLKDKKTVVKKGKKVVLSASTSSSPKSKIVKYEWDVNGDGIIDYVSEGPYVEHQYDTNYDGQVCVTVTDAQNISSTDCVDIGASDDDAVVTDEEPIVLPSPSFSTSRNGTDLIISWVPVEGSIVFYDADGAVIAIANGQGGTFTLHHVPAEAFDLSAQLVNGFDESEYVPIHVNAAPLPTPESVPTTPTTPTTTQPVADVPSDEPAPVLTQPLSVTTKATGNTLGAYTNSATLLNSIKPIATTDDSELTFLDTNVGGLTLAMEGGNGAVPKSTRNRIKDALTKGLEEFSGVVADYLAWLIVMLLLLIWLYVKSRKRDEDSYQYDQPKKYPSRKVVLVQG